MATLPFKFTFLGQSILKFQVPLDIYHALNSIYESNITTLLPANKQLAGKIEKEHSLFYNGENESKIKKHNLLSYEILNWFNDVYHQYLIFNHVADFKMSINSIWVNEMKVNEYNPAHIHQGTSPSGLSSVMILKLPDTYGEEYSAKDSPTNGKLQMLGTASGQFAKVDYEPEVEVRDFYVFPYDLRHLVYPFNGTTNTRRTLAGNCDVWYPELINRGAHEYDSIRT